MRRQPVAKTFADVTLGYGRYGTFEASLDGNAATGDGKLAFRLNATTQGTDNYRDVGDGSIKAVNPTLTWRPDDRTRLGLDFEYVESRWPPDTGIPFVGQESPELAPVPRTTSYQSPFDGSTQDVYRFRFVAERKIGTGLTLRNRFYYTELTWDSDGTLVVGVFPGPDGRLLVARSLVLLDDRQKLPGQPARAERHLRHRPRAPRPPGRLRAPEPEGPLHPGRGPAAPRSTCSTRWRPPQPPIVTIPPFAQAGDSRAFVVAPYVVDRLRFSPKVQAFVGARLDVLDYEDPLNETERDDTRVNPLLGLTWSPVEDLSLHASWGTASAPPSTQVVGPRDPEESRQAELGGKLTFLDGRGFAGLAVYELRRENIAIPDSTGVTRQDGDQRSRGVELDLTVEPARGWSVQGGYAFTDSDAHPLLRDRAASAPGLRGRRPLGEHRPLRPASPLRPLGVEALRHGTRPGRGPAPRGRPVHRPRQPGRDRRLHHARRAPSRTTRSRWGLRVHLRNITDTEYETRGFGSASAIPARPFEVRAQLVLGFGER